MKEQTVILPELPIVGTLRLTSRDGKTLAAIDVVKKQKPSTLTPFFKHCHDELRSFLAGESKEFTIPLDLKSLSPFQKKVLIEMKKIPYGKTASYKDLAVQLKSRAYQAIGSACGRNPLMLIYPCHRVLGSRDLGGFAHGLKMKKEILRIEGHSV